MGDAEKNLLKAVENALDFWGCYRVLPEQYYVDLCNSMRKLTEALEPYDEARESE
jgi:hypothetical protein